MEVKILESVGLTKNEVRVYITLLQKGPSNAGNIIKYSGITSSKVYENLERLESKGLVGYTKETNKKRFFAADPERLLDYIEERKNKLEENAKSINEILPELELMKKNLKEEYQEVEIFQGLKGYRTILETMLKELGKNGEYMAFASGMLKEILGSYWHIFQKKKENLKINAKCLWDPKVKEKKDYMKEYYGTGKFISKGSYMSPVDIWIYNDTVIQASYTSKPIFAVIIKSKGFADSYRELFNNLWKIAKK